MARIGELFGWMRRPQLLISFAVLCFGVGAAGGMLRSTQVFSSTIPRDRPHVKGVTTPHPPNTCAAMPCIALTFDDGPSEAVTPLVLDILARQNVKATFFVVGQRIAGREPILQKTYREGHEIGNHSWSHPHFTRISPADVELQIRMTQTAITNAGVPAPHIFRPPYGDVDNMVMGHMDMSVIRWNVDPEDWRSKNPEKIRDTILAQAKPGAIILLHDTDQATVAALEPAITALKPHYQFVTVSQLLRLTPGDPGQYFGR